MPTASKKPSMISNHDRTPARNRNVTDGCDLGDGTNRHRGQRAGSSTGIVTRVIGNCNELLMLSRKAIARVPCSLIIRRMHKKRAGSDHHASSHRWFYCDISIHRQLCVTRRPSVRVTLRKSATGILRTQLRQLAVQVERMTIGVAALKS